MSEKQTRVISVTNQKGGVGKTTTSLHLAAGFAERGKLCLIIDLDASAGATKTLGVPTVGWNTTYELLAGEAESSDVILTDEDDEVRLPKNIHIIPSSPKLNEIEAFLNSTDNLGIIPQNLLLGPINELRGRYDYVILDSPPLVTKTTFPAYKASDYVLLCTQLEKLSVEALESAMKLLATARKHGNPQLTLIGVVETMVPQPLTRLAQHFRGVIDDVVRDAEGESLRFDVALNRHVAIQEAATAKQTLFQYAPGHKAVEQYRKLVSQIEARIDRIERKQLPMVANG